jgi:uncharacterized UPF0160 family protein
LAKVWYFHFIMYTVVTHDGRFHADDIFGVAVVQLRFGAENIHLIRTREQAHIDEADIVLDVGGIYDSSRMRFDHHQNGAPVRENGLPYAAFGLLWKEFGPAITGSEVIAEKIEKKLAQPIDAGDNGIILYNTTEHDIAPAEVYDLVESFMPPLGSHGDANEAFMKAVEVARAYLERVIERAKIKEALREKARAGYDSAEDKTVIVFDVPMKRDLLMEFPEVKIIVTPDEEGSKWSALAVPTEDGTFETRVLFPSDWAGLRDEELAEVSGVPDAIFCHKNLFLFVARSKEGAVEAAKKAV